MKFENFTNYIFSDKYKLINIFVCIIILFYMGFWNYSKYILDEVTLEKCIKNPEKYDLAEIKIVQDSTVSGINDSGLIINSRGYKIPVEIKKDDKAKKYVINDYISMLAVFHKEGYLEPKKYHIHKNRRVKMLTSIIIILPLLFMFFYLYKFNFRKLIFEVRKCRI